MGFLPIILILIFPILSFIFGGDGSTPAVPHMSYEFPQPPNYMSERPMPNIPVNYYIDPNDVANWNSYKLKQLDKRAESNFLTKLKYDCENEHALKQRLEQEARGWFRPDPAKMEMAAKLELPACNRLRQFGVIF
jgi:DnaJ family protein B protein 12